MKDRIERVSRILFRKIFERERIFLPFIDEIRRDSMLAGVSIASRKRVIHRLRPRHRIMEMYLAPILILYYFPAEFSRHLYDNARQRRKFSHFPAREILPPPRIILPPSVSIALQRSPRSRTGHKLSSPLHCLLSNTPIHRLDLVSPPLPPPPPINFLRRTKQSSRHATPSILASAFEYPDIFIDARIHLFIRRIRQDRANLKRAGKSRET